VQAISLLGDTLRTPELPPDVREEREARLAEAQVAYERDPASANAVIWLGRRWGYLGEYRRAVAVFSEGIARHPRDARLYRHRGHRYVTLRLLDRAVDDLTQAASLVEGGPDEVEPDGLPNLRNIPTSTLQTNIWYHLGLAHYLLGHFEEALAAYRRCLALSTNPDMLVATTHWLYMTLRRLGRDAEAEAVLEPIHAGMDIIENGAYHKLVLMYKGEITPGALLAEADGTDALESATLAYGIGNFHLHNGRPDEARTVFRRIVAGSEWAAFGYLAAEAELARGNP
jgi:tetratricopeptide (TPR) repeat protein